MAELWFIAIGCAVVAVVSAAVSAWLFVAFLADRRRIKKEAFRG